MRETWKNRRVAESERIVQGEIAQPALRVAEGVASLPHNDTLVNTCALDAEEGLDEAQELTGGI